MHSDVAEVGRFKCSDQLLNTIFDICRNSYLSNLFGIPTDCPTREKNGWMADGFMVQEAGMFNYDSRNVYAKWVKDMIDTQEANGRYFCLSSTRPVSSAICAIIRLSQYTKPVAMKSTGVSAL